MQRKFLRTIAIRSFALVAVFGSPILASPDTLDGLTVFLIPVGHWSDGTADGKDEHTDAADGNPHAYNERKFFSSCFPDSVSTDSG